MKIKHEKKSILGVILSRLGGLLMFLILLAIANLLVPYVPVPIYSRVVHFLNGNLGLILIFSIAFFLAELFSALSFPFNVPHPVFNAIGSVLLLKFLVKILFTLLRDLGIQEVLAPFEGLGWLIYPLLFFMVLIAGYFKIFTRGICPSFSKK